MFKKKERDSKIYNNLVYDSKISIGGKKNNLINGARIDESIWKNKIKLASYFMLYTGFNVKFFFQFFKLLRKYWETVLSLE